MTMTDKDIKEYFKKIGGRGGKATAERYGPDHFRKISRLKKGMTWTWNPAKKGKRKSKGLQSKQEGANMPELPNKQ